MKLITIPVLILIFDANGISNEQFVFPPKFQTPGPFVSDSSLYLPPESHTPIPYFAVKKHNLPFPYLPATATKSPVPYPPPFPIVLSSSIAPNFDDDDDDKDDERDKKYQLPPQQQFQYKPKNRTDKVQEDQTMTKRDTRPLPKMFSYQHPIDRVDIKLPPLPPNGFTTATPNHTARSMIISAETHRNDWMDLLKSGSSQNPHLLSPPGNFLIPTTEPAIPILRLSNEMDLDGSFSYEALGADQTHYVQHSHMENLGSDKAEQVVEGSYSYVGDNGQTYTVNYIADSNGFRASGDHLPVAPPIPEIIQRSIQYNLAEEAKRPPGQKSWQSDEQERDYNEFNDKSQRFAVSPLRNLFTGKTPEAFSYDFSQRHSLQNALNQAASNQSPVKTSPDFTNNQSKSQGGSILPQITFLASQGAHVPSLKTPQTVERMFQTEKSVMPQLMNYENDDSSKALWRWQYGLNSNNVNQTPEKNTISRSSGEGDDVMINFNDMTAEQYTKMIQSQVPTNSKENVETPKDIENTVTSNYFNNYYKNVRDKSNENEKYQTNNDYTESRTMSVSSTEISTPDPSKMLYPNSYNNINPYFNQMDTIQQEGSRLELDRRRESHQDNMNVRSNIISAQSFVPSVQTITQEYNFEHTTYEPKKIQSLHPSTMKPYQNNFNQIPQNDHEKLNSPSYTKTKINEVENDAKFSVTHTIPTISNASNLKFVDFISRDDEKDEFKPVIQTNENKREEHTLSTEIVDEVALNNNVFLRNLFNNERNKQKVYNKMIADAEKQLLKNMKNQEQNIIKNTKEDSKNPFQLPSKKIEHSSFDRISEDKDKQHLKKTAETKSDKISQYINVPNSPFNEVKPTKKKTFDMSDVLNYITMKNHFESSKIKSKNNPSSFGASHPSQEMQFIPIQGNANDGDDENYNVKQSVNSIRPIYQSPGELRGNIKNYKVLHRNNNALNVGYDSNGIKRELMPPPLKLHSQSLPPLGRAGPTTKSYLPPLYV